MNANETVEARYSAIRSTGNLARVHAMKVGGRVEQHGDEWLILVPTPDEPVDPDTMFLDRAAVHITEAFPPKVLYRSPAQTVQVLALLSMWEDLTGLVGEDAIAYARRLVATPGEVTAHIPAF